MISAMIIWMIRGYQHLISRFMPPVCRFHPSCSQYTCVAVDIHGPIRGGWLAAQRIARCNPLFEGGQDPVPDLMHGGSAHAE